MRRSHGRPPAARQPLLAHLRSTVWGPADFVGLPPWWLIRKGLLTGVCAAAAVVGATVAGAWYGIPALAQGEAGLLCAAGLALYLRSLRAGRALLAVVAVLGVCLALRAPQTAAGLVLAERGRVESMVVMSVEEGAAFSGDDRYLCSVADRDGVPLKVRIWRGCGRATRPGDALSIVYDEKGRVPPRGVEPGAPLTGPLRELGGWIAALVAGSLVAVVRSYRLSPAPQASPNPAAFGTGTTT